MGDEKPPTKKPNPLGGIRAAADLLKGLDAATRNRILSNVAQRDSKLAAAIQQRIFTFEDLPRLSSWDIQTLLRKVPQQKLALALRNAPQELSDFIFANLSRRSRELLQEDIQALGPRKVSDIEAAQTEIAELARSLLKIDDPQ